MGRGTKRKLNKTKEMWSSGGSSSRRKKKESSSSSKLSTSAIEKMFDGFSDPDDATIASMEGISKLCEQLELDPLEDVRVLVLLWKMDANEKPAQITKSEWTQGCKKLGVDSITKLKALVPSLDLGFLDQSEFKDFYKFCFQFNRQGTHRTLDVDLVVALWQLVLGDRVPSDRLTTFSNFLEENKNTYKLITLDQWTSFLDFCNECEDLSSYDEASSAWPVLIDEYVEYMEQQQSA